MNEAIEPTRTGWMIGTIISVIAVTFGFAVLLGFVR